MKSEESKSMDVLNRTLPLGNLGTNPKELIPQNQLPKSHKETMGT
jgi:hypothetical protein